MLKLILYAVIFYAIYRYISRLGRLEEKVDQFSKNKDGNQTDRKDNKKEGEYIDYEEIK